jgi:hypothetical protein
MQYLIQLSLLLLASHTTLADLILMSPRSPIPELQSLNRRQFCPYSLAICSSFDGQAVCQDIDEVCCQLADGTTPYTCSYLFPFHFLGFPPLHRLFLTPAIRSPRLPLVLPLRLRRNPSLRLERTMHRPREQRPFCNRSSHRCNGNLYQSVD